MLAVLPLLHHGVVNLVYLFPIHGRGFASLLPVAVDEEVSQNGQEPGPDVGPWFKLVEEAKGAQIGFLDQVYGLRLVLGEL